MGPLHETLCEKKLANFNYRRFLFSFRANFLVFYHRIANHTKQFPINVFITLFIIGYD